MEREYKHGPELRQFWKEQKAKYRANKRKRVVAAEGSDPSNQQHAQANTLLEVKAHG